MVQRLLLLCLMTAVSMPAFALRCGNKIVGHGDHQARILKICGEPTAIQIRHIYRSGTPASHYKSSARHPRYDRDELILHDRSVVEVVVEEWTYNFGPRRLMRVIRFENGIVSSVKRLGYGYLD